MMLHYSNLQFTNATRLNDPFDCHPSLIDFSNVPKEACGGWTPEIIEKLRKEPFRRTREEAWICSLSKIHDSILMWSYYSKHKGICIGLDMKKVRKYLSCIQGGIMIGCSEVEVQYKDIVEKPNLIILGMQKISFVINYLQKQRLGNMNKRSDCLF